jgi:hypothetical protein
MDLNGFNALDIEPTQSSNPIPADWYEAVIGSAEQKPTKAGTGSYLELTIEIVSGAYQGRKVWDRLNLQNPNSTAVEIAQRSLSSICRSIGVNNPKDSIELCDKPLMVKIAVKASDGQYDASNEVKGYEAAGGASSTNGTAATASPVVATASASTPPWKK